MNELLKICLVVCPLVFLAGFVDSVAGGGGLISLPAYMLVGLPSHLASGTNKVVNAFGTMIASIKYIKSGKVKLVLSLFAAAGALIGSAIGTKIALLIDGDILKIIILCALPVMVVIILTKKNFGLEEQKESRFGKKAEMALCTLIGLFIGCYDGMIGPGTGTLMIIAFTAVIGIDLLTASGCAKIANLASNVASAVVWIAGGKVMWAIVAPAAACSILGNYLGSRFAIKGGAHRVRYVMIVVLALIFIKIITDLI